MLLVGFFGMVYGGELFPAGDGDGEVVYLVPQFSEFKEVSEQDMFFLKKVLKEAEEKKVKAVIFELDTPGGRVDVALRYISIFAKSRVPVIAYVNPQGISAGMIIALGADRIAINPLGVIGDAMPLELSGGKVRPIAVEPEKVPLEKAPEGTAEKVEDKEKDKKDPEKAAESTVLEKLVEELKKSKEEPVKSPGSDERKNQNLADQKFLTVFFKVLQVLAEKNDRPVKVIRATSDPYVVLTKEADGIEHASGSPLTLSAKEAKELKVVDYIAANPQEILNQLGIPKAKLEIVKKSPAEQIVAFLAQPVLAGILIMLGLVGLFVEIKTPGFGVSGVLGILCLVLFFLGHVASGASEWGPMVIFFVGVLLLLMEIFVIPGFGLVGVLGFGCMVWSFFAAFGFGNFDTAVRVVGLSLLGTIAVLVLLVMYVLPKTSIFKRFALQSSISTKDGFNIENGSEEADFPEKGRHGVALSALRPAGTVEIDGSRFDAITSGEFITPGSAVKVTGRQGFQLKVKEEEDSTAKIG